MSVSGADATAGPACVRVLVEIANTRELTVRPDLLAEPGTAAGVLRDLSLLSPQAALTEDVLKQVRRFRDALHGVLADREDKAAWSALNALAGMVPLRAEFGDGVVELAAAADDGPLTGLVLSLYHTVASKAWGRIRLCANEECAAAFYDATRSRTQKWHSYTDCGNRANVAAHRARTRLQSEE